MEKDFMEVLKFANENPDCWLATCEDNQPHVRGILLWYADETGFYFHTAKAKRMCSQMEKNPRAEAVFRRALEGDPVGCETLHVAGSTELLDDAELLERLSRERHWLWDNITASGVDTEVAVFRIVHGEASIWSSKWNVKEREMPKIPF